MRSSTVNRHDDTGEPEWQQCWQRLRLEDLIISDGVCDCRDGCQRKSELVDALMDYWDAHDTTDAALLRDMVAKTMVGFDAG